ncbi:MAG: phosphotransferase family protein [Polyangiales bacterium]
MRQAPQSTVEPPETHRIDPVSLEKWMQTNVEGFGGSLTIRKFKGGQSNPTYWLADDERAYVLRKKPPGKLLPSAHAIDREYRVMHALRDTDVPVAKMYGYCADESVIGQPFYIMEFMEGRTFWDAQLKSCEREERTAIYEELARVLAALHTVDVEKVGLSDYGKSGGYVERQVKRWSEQYRASQTTEVPTMESLIKWLQENLPAADETTLTHGDYRLDNVIVHSNEAHILSVIDWELSTLGHPLADLGYFCMLYDVSLPKIGGLLGTDFKASGIPTEAEFVKKYCEYAGRDSVPDLQYFKAFSLFRLAAIAQGVFKRSQQGNASSPEAALFGAAVPHLSGVACRLINTGVA